MIERLIREALSRPLVVGLAAIAVALAGAWGFARLPFDAFPDVTNVQVQVIADAPGLAPGEVERLVTRPIELELAGLPKVEDVRSISKFGLGVVTVVFHDDTDIYFARQMVGERLNAATGELPAGAKAAMGPIATGMGEIFQYAVEGPQPLSARRTAQDWIARPMLRQVPGVTEVNSLGGELVQHQVLVEPDRLAAYGLGIEEVASALSAANANAAGNYIVHGDEQYLVRGVGLLAGPEALGSVVVARRAGKPVFVRDVATIAEGAAPRQGAATRNGSETVVGVVMKLKGENSREVIGRVEARLAEVQRALPTGMRLVPFYNQLELVERAVATVERSLVEGGVLVVAVLAFFLWHVRASLIVAVTIPLAMLFAFALMNAFHLPGNLMSLGGLAIGLGMMVDASIVMVENVFRAIAEDEGERPVGEVVAEAACEVGRPIVFAIGIIVAVFVPLFTLTGMEGKMFAPMAVTICFALVGSLGFALTLVPVLARWALPRGLKETENPVFAAWRRGYDRALAWTFAHGRVAVAAALAALVGAVALVPALGTEFLPAMDEGSSVITASRLASVSLDKANAQSEAVERALLRFPEVKQVVSRTGRAEVASDPMDVSASDIFIELAPRDTWRTATTKAGLVAAFERAVSGIPGIGLSFGEPIAVRVDEMISGVKSQVAVKLFGEDLAVLAEKGDAIQRVIARVPGASNVKIEQLGGLQQLAVTYDRAAMARLGLSAEDLGRIVAMAVGGHVATELQEGQRRVGVAVRLPEALRSSPEAIAAIPVPLPGGGRVPLGQVADVSLGQGPTVIAHENGARRVVVECNVHGRDIGGFVAEAQAALQREVPLPAGYTVAWGGQFENQQRAMGTLSVVVPLVIATIFVLLVGSFGSARHAALVLLNVPFALVGGIAALFVSHQHLSVSASVGFIALFGVAVQNGVLMITTFNRLRGGGMAVDAAVAEGARLRLRPVLMTALVASLGLVPLALSHGIGSEIQRPLAWVVIGGLVSSTALTLLLLPLLYRAIEQRGRTSPPAAPPAAPPRAMAGVAD